MLSPSPLPLSSLPLSPCGCLVAVFGVAGSLGFEVLVGLVALFDVAGGVVGVVAGVSVGAAAGLVGLVGVEAGVVEVVVPVRKPRPAPSVEIADPAAVAVPLPPESPFVPACHSAVLV